ncbi:hypothetical protein [Azospirillum picis]|uniref:Uncharacterized protein n=1 Tax=Azospirillum picis TaxID=488438 RepID=A0ABU0MEC8_9PROT|nr:hypothetical protein [Azospirillum picis]MBP2297954.1 hypothetical protein [Azospirillum picis]MDQ0531792.1 hypothetical protein [Azospirillum picis]
MDIPAHRAAAVAPTPAHSFELRDGDQLVNLTEEERKAAEAAASTRTPATKGRRPAAEAPSAPASTAE